VTRNVSLVQRLASIAMWLADGRMMAAGPARAVLAQHFAADTGARFVASRRTNRPQFLSAELVGRRGSSPARLPADEACRFRIRYVVPDDWPGLTVGMSVLAADGSVIFTANTADSGLRLAGRACEYEAAVVVPGGTLAGGDYHLGLRIWDRGDTYDFQEPALSFSIEPSPGECPDVERRGFVHVPCEWTIVATVDGAASSSGATAMACSL
jgi:hypothetical protein